MGFLDKIFKKNNNKKEENSEHKKQINFDWLYHKKERKWDDLNRPIGYIVGVTPGFAQIQRSPESFKDLGLMRKYMKGALYGFEFIQLDFETISEINERYLWKMIDEAKRYQGLEIGLHAPVTGEAAVDLGIAYADKWRLHHETIRRSAYAAGDILGAKYFLFHSSSSARPNIVFGMAGQEGYTPRAQLFSYTGVSLGIWLKQLDGKEKTVFEGKTYDYFVDPCYRKIYKPIDGFSFIDYFKARHLNVLFEARGAALDPDIGIYFYYFDSFKEGIEKAEELRDNALNKALRVYRDRTIMRINNEMNQLKNSIDEINKHLTDPNIDQQTKNNLEDQRNTYNQLLSTLDNLHQKLSKLETQHHLNELELTPVDAQLLIGSGLIYRILSDISSTFSPDDTGAIIKYFNNLLDYVLNNIALDKLVDPKIDNVITIKERRAIKAYYTLMRYSITQEDAFEYWAIIKGSEASEEVAYLVTAKFMYKYKDYLWQEIVGKRYETGIDDAYDPDDVVLATNLGFKKMRDFYYFEENGEMPFKERLNKYSPEFQKYILEKEKRTPFQIAEDIVTAVAAKYIQGHLFVKDEWAMDTLPEWLYRIGSLKQENVNFNNESVWDYIERGGTKTNNKPIMVFIETEQPVRDSLIGRLRIMKAKHHVILVKSIVEYAANLLKNPTADIIPREKGPYKDLFAYNMDFEHLSINLIDPVEDVKTLEEGEGKYIKMLHINAPRPYGGQHGPLYMLNEELYTIYEWLWELRKKGMKNAYFIWEMGSYGIYQSALAFRRMAIALENDIPPDELPPEFYGLDEALLAEQKRVLIEHAYDPLEGLLMQPEEKHTFLGNAAREKGRLDKWLGEEQR